MTKRSVSEILSSNYEDSNSGIENKLSSIIHNFDIHTTNAQLEHTNINTKSINTQTGILTLILVIFITLVFIVHLKQ